MKELRTFLLYLMAITVNIVILISVMIKGWGLEPQSWWWIIGVYYLGGFVAKLISMAGDSGEE